MPTYREPGEPQRRPAPAPAPAAKPTAKRTTAKKSAGTKKSAPRQAAAPRAAAAPAPPAPDKDQLIREQYSQHAWMLDHPELGAILRKAAEEGWDENRLRGAVFPTQWMRDHGAANVTAQLKEQASQFLVGVSDDTAKKWALQVITGQVQPAEYMNWVKTQAKSRFTDKGLHNHIERGGTVAQFFDPYREDAARELGINPLDIDLNEDKWLRALDHTDGKGNRGAMTRADWVSEIRKNPLYGYDKTANGKRAAATLAEQLAQQFGGIG